MAERRSGGKGGKRIPHHPLVEALAPDPNQPPKKATRLFGFPGPAADTGSTRLWLDPDLTSYVDVPDEAILHSQTLDNDQGTLIWVESEAQLTHSTVQSQEMQAEFLGGSIAERNLPGAALRSQGGFRWGEGPLRTPFTRVYPQCPQSELPPCIVSVNIPCPSRQLPCQTPDWPCTSRGIECQTPGFPCRTEPPICPDLLSSLRCPTPGAPCTPETVVSPAGPCDEPPGGGFGPVVDPVGPFRPRGGFR